MTTIAPTPHRWLTAPGMFPALTATVRNRDGATVEIVESAAYDAYPDFVGYVWRAIAAGYLVELFRASGGVDPEGRP